MIAFKGGRLHPRGHRTGLGKRFIPLMRYLADGPRGAERPDRVLHFATRHLPADTPKAAGYLMACCAEDRRPDFELPVYHFGASAAEGESLTPAQWEHVADWMLAELGLAEHESAIVVHDDAKCQHVHIVVNRIGVDSKPFKPWMDYPKMRRAMRRAEREFGLQVVAEPLGHGEEQPVQPVAEPAEPAAEPAAHSSKPATHGRAPEASGRALAAEPARPVERPDQPRLSDVEFLKARQNGVQPLADAIRERALRDFLEAGSWQDLDRRLVRHGLRLEPARRGGGVVVRTDDDERVSISKIERRLSGPKLAKRFGMPFRTHRLMHSKPDLPKGFLPVCCAYAGSANDQVAALIERIGRERATFTEQEIRRHVRWRRDQAEIVAAALDDPRVERIGRDEDGRPLFTTSAYRRQEADLFQAADALRKRSHANRTEALDAKAVRRLLDQRFAFLADEQQTAVLHASCESDLALISGRAGSGKTALTRAIVQAHVDAGLRVQGAALTGKAAEGLGREIGIQGRTIASLRRSWVRGRDRLDERTVLLVDEAGMLGTREMAQLLATVEKAGAKAILVGDPDQMRPIEAGDAFAGLLDAYDGARLDIIRRQRVEWMREASTALAEGRVADTLRAYDRHGTVRWSTDRHAACWDLVDSYLADRERHPDASRLVLARRNADVDELNALIRLHRHRHGELGAAIRVGGREIAVHDRVVFTRNDPFERRVQTLGLSRRRSGSDPDERAGVQNGTFGKVLAVRRDEVRVRIDDGRMVCFDPRRYPHLRHGYAATLHKGQGATVDRSFVLLDPHLGLEGTYVAATRHRDHLELWLDRRSFADLQAASVALGRRGPNDLLARCEDSDGESDESRALDRLRSMVERQAVVTWDDLLERPEDRPTFENLSELVRLDDEHVTTRAYLDAEEHLAEVARTLSRRCSSRVGNEPPPEADGVDPVVHAADGPDLTVFEGDSADAQQLFESIVDQYRGTDREPLVVTFAAREADALGRQLDIEAHTFAGLANRPERVGERTVLLVDRAHLTDTRTLDQLLVRAEVAGSRVVLVGDAHGFDAIASGDAFRLVREDLGVVTLRPETESPALQIDEIFEELVASDRLILDERARLALAKRYMAAPVDERPLVLVHRRRTVEQLNQLIRSRRPRELGRAVDLGGRSIAEGDRVVFTASDPRGQVVRPVDGGGTGVRSGALGTVVQIDGESLRVRLDEGRTVAFDPKEFDAVDYGYVLTTFRATGHRADDVLVLAERSMDRASAMVALSSHERSVTVYASSLGFEGGVDQVAETLARQRSKPLARDVSQERQRAPRPRLRIDQGVEPLSRDRRPRSKPVDDIVEAAPSRETSTGAEAIHEAIERLHAFDHNQELIAEIREQRATLPNADNPEYFQFLYAVADEGTDDWEVYEQMQAYNEQLAVLHEATGNATRDPLIEQILMLHRRLEGDARAQIASADRAFVEELEAMTVKPLEEAAAVYEQMLRDFGRERGMSNQRDIAQRLAYDWGVKATLAVAPRKVKRVAAVAFRVAELIEDTPKALRRLILPKPIQQIGSALRLVRDLTPRPASEPKPAVQQPARPRKQATRRAKSARQEPQRTQAPAPGREPVPRPAASRQPTRRVAARPARSRPVAPKTRAPSTRPVAMSDLEIACLLAPDQYQPLFKSLLDQVRKQERTQARARQRERGGVKPGW